MTTYQYIAKDKNGQTLSGRMEASSEQEVAELLHKKGLVIVSVREVRLKGSIAMHRPIKADDIVIFSRQLSTMIDAGIPLVQALEILSEQIENKALRDIVVKVRQDIEGGLTFPDALNKHPKVFSELFINMARAGEASGSLDEILDRLALYLEKASSLVRKVRSALIYPIVVVVIAVLITGVLLLKVVPAFKGIFEMLGGRLPLPTLILIWISDLLRKFFLFLLAFLVLLIFVFRKYLKTKKGRYKLDAFKLRLPVLGPLFCKVAIAKFCRTFSTLVKSGVPILNALDIVANTAGNKVIEEVVLGCHQAVRDIFPPMAWRMIGVGEKTGQLEKMLSKVADFYEEQVDSAVAGLTSVIEPIVIGFLGIVIGGIVISLFLPVFKISELVTR